jgi:hypothetical protein
MMPYKDPKKDLECKLRWQKKHPENFKRYYEKHKDVHQARCKDWQKRNREKHLAYRREWNKKNVDRFWGYRLKQLYGISVEEYKALFEKQEGRCAICGKKPKGRLHVDHDHKTGKVRGLLCPVCNLRIGTLETFGLVEKSIAYLEKYK